jgi:hypothetical protein
MRRDEYTFQVLPYSLGWHLATDFVLDPGGNFAPCLLALLGRRDCNSSYSYCYLSPSKNVLITAAISVSQNQLMLKERKEE